ncbi:MAG: hypothetical protein ACTHK5_03280 [Tsuneonella sp.]
MTEASFASLSPTLLARKGGAKPAMRPQLAASLAMSGPVAAANLDDLGWNDMGDEDGPQSSAEVVRLTAPPHSAEADQEARENDRETAAQLAQAQEPLVLRQREALAARVAEPEVAAPKKRSPVRARRSALDRGSRAAFTLRLDSERHLKLRLACTVRGRSAQQLVTEALDALLDEMPDVGSLAAQVQRS